MFHALRGPLEDFLHRGLAPAAVEPFTLWLNHVVSREPVAMARLTPHAGRVVRLDLQAWPSSLPAPLALLFGITRAGLFEWRGREEAAQGGEPDEPSEHLVVRLDVGRPDRLFQGLLAGERPAVKVEGDAALAGDIDWLIRNLRWDVADDVERLAGPLAAQVVTRGGELLASALAALRRPPPASQA